MYLRHFTSRERIAIKNIKQRDPYFDNARFILVVLVVFGHFISPVRNDHELIYQTNNFLSLFRMPALILLTGFLAKGFYKEGYIEKITKKIFIPYIIFQVIYTYYYYHLYDRASVTLDLFSPQYTLWFLLSLFIWNLLLFIFTKMKYPLIIAVALGVGVGFIDSAGHYFSIHRTFVFFPFFLLGYYLKKEHFRFLYYWQSKVVAAVILVVIWFAIDVFSHSEARSWVLGMSNYEGMGYDQWYIGGVRIMFYLFSICVAFSFLAFIPKNRTFFTHLGTRTAYVYLLHGALIRTLYEVLFPEQFTTIWQYLVIPVYALIMAFLLASTPVQFLTKPLVEGKIIDLIMKPINSLMSIGKKQWKYLIQSKL